MDPVMPTLSLALFPTCLSGDHPHDMELSVPGVKAMGVGT